MTSNERETGSRRAGRLLLAGLLGVCILALVFWSSRRGPGAAATPGAAAPSVTGQAASPQAQAPPRFVRDPSRPPSERCRQCKQQRCTEPLYHPECSRVPGQAAAGGPADGRSKDALCAAVVACVRARGCLAKGDDLQPCYCGTADDEPCLTGQANGPCKEVIEAAAESVAPEEVATRFAEAEYAIAQAVHHVRCEEKTCLEECR